MDDEAKPAIETKAEPVSSNDDMLAYGRAVGINNFDEADEYKDKLNILKKWAKAKGAKDLPDALWQIRQLQTRLGGPKFGQTMAEYLAQYAYLELERMTVDNQLKHFEPNG